MLSITRWILEKSDLLVVFGVVAKKDLWIRWLEASSDVPLIQKQLLREEKGMGFKIVANFRIFSICQGQWKNCSFPAVFLYQFIASLVAANLDTWGTLARPKVPSPRSFCTWYLAYLQAELTFGHPLQFGTRGGCFFGKRLDTRISTPQITPRFGRLFFPLRLSDPFQHNVRSSRRGQTPWMSHSFQWRTPSCHPASGPGNDPEKPLGTAKDPIYKSKWWLHKCNYIHTHYHYQLMECPASQQWSVKLNAV